MLQLNHVEVMENSQTFPSGASVGNPATNLHMNILQYIRQPKKNFHSIQPPDFTLMDSLQSQAKSCFQSWLLHRGIKSTPTQKIRQNNVLILPLQQQSNSSEYFVCVVLTGWVYPCSKVKCIYHNQHSAVPSHLCPHLQPYSPALSV